MPQKREQGGGMKKILRRLGSAEIIRCSLALLFACRSHGGYGQRTVDLAQTRGFALQLPQVEQLGAADLVRTDYLNLVQNLGVEREDTFHALAKADLAHGKAALRPFALGDDRAFKRLHALFVAFLDLYLYADGVARIDVRNVLALQLRSQFFHH